MIKLNKKSGLVLYLTCGDPDLATTKSIVLAAIDAGADVIELGVPFSDPLADGPIIQRASERALKNNVSLKDVLGLAKEIRAARPNAGLILFSYLNPVIQFARGSYTKFASDVKAAGLDGALITDLTVEEAGDYIKAMRAHYLATVFLAAPTSTDLRLKLIAQSSTGFIYAVSRTGITGTQSQVSNDAQLLAKRIRKFSKLPIALGFGISNAAQFREVCGYADAAVIGSAIVKLIEQSKGQEANKVKSFIASLND